jgi:hypothetical protein
VQHVGTAPTAFYFGGLDGRPSERVASLVDAFNKAGFGARQAADIRHVEWEKLLQIATLCAWSVSSLGVMPGGSVARRRRARRWHNSRCARATCGLSQPGYEPRLRGTSASASSRESERGGAGERAGQSASMRALEAVLHAI